MGATTGFVLGSLRRSWRLLAAAMLVGALAGGVTSLVLPARYRATAYLLGGKAGTDPIDSTLLIGESAVYARVATDPTVMGPALHQAGLAIDPVHLGRFVTAAADPNSPLLAITATTGSASEAAALANTVARRMASYSQGFAQDTGYGE